MIRYVTQHPRNEQCYAPKYERDYWSLIRRCAYVMGTYAVDHRRAVIRRIILRLPRNGEKRITDYADVCVYACLYVWRRETGSGKDATIVDTDIVFQREIRFLS